MNSILLGTENPLFLHNIDKLCAVCMKELVGTGAHSLATLLSDVEPDVQVLDALKFVTKQFNVDDCPQMLCPCCFNDLQIAYKFQKACEQAQIYIQCFHQHQEHIKHELEDIEDTLGPDPDNSRFDIEAEDQQGVIEKVTEVAEVSTTGVMESFADEEVNSEGENFSSLQPNGKQKEKCIVCTKSVRSDYMKKHMRLHTGELPFACTLCDTRFTTKTTLQLHQLVHETEANHICQYCGRAFRRIEKLKFHLAEHTDDKSHQCSICQKRFVLACHLKHHMIFHENRRDFVCSECGRAFYIASHLKAHMRTHTGEKRYRCVHCDRAFGAHHSLKTHLRMHTGERPFQCDECSKCFTQKYALQVHRRTHANDRRHVCSVCTKTFIQRANLLTHMRTHADQVLPLKNEEIVLVVMPSDDVEEDEEQESHENVN